MRRSATLPDHSQTSRIPVPISLSLDFDPQDPPESKASVCDTIRPLADFQDTGANKFKHIFRLPRPSRVESVSLRHYQTTRRLPGYRCQLVYAYILTHKTLPSRKRRSATLPDHSQTSRIPVPIK